MTFLLISNVEEDLPVMFIFGMTGYLAIDDRLVDLPCCMERTIASARFESSLSDSDRHSVEDACPLISQPFQKLPRVLL